jgi:NAD(P)-dependent dehydrogenase (short-subunit alcohol dehydrogenase family)
VATPRPSKAAGSVALVTGANRGIGLAFVRELAARGAKRVYACVREPGAPAGTPDRRAELRQHGELCHTMIRFI